MEKIRIKDLYNIDETIAKELFEQNEYPWECLSMINDFILKLGESLDKNKYEKKDDNIWIAKSAKVSPMAVVIGPTIIDENAEIRPFSYIRGRVIIGKDAVVGNSTEIKNAILFNEAKVPHFNYVGDSILGYKSHLGASVILSNLRSDEKEVIIKNGEQEVNTNRRKVGAIIGDNVEIGCNSVLNPGTIVGKNTMIYPLLCLKGVISENTIYKG